MTNPQSYSRSRRRLCSRRRCRPNEKKYIIITITSIRPWTRHAFSYWFFYFLFFSVAFCFSFECSFIAAKLTDTIAQSPRHLGVCAWMYRIVNDLRAQWIHRSVSQCITFPHRICVWKFDHVYAIMSKYYISWKAISIYNTEIQSKLYNNNRVGIVVSQTHKHQYRWK